MWLLTLMSEDTLHLARQTRLHILSFLTIGIIVLGCDPVAREEIIRIHSVDSVVDAVLIQTNAGATTSFGSEVYLVPTSKPISKNNLLFRGDKMEGLELRWIQPKLLEIQYEQGRIFHFSNFWVSKQVQNFKYQVEIRLVKVDK